MPFAVSVEKMDEDFAKGGKTYSLDYFKNKLDELDPDGNCQVEYDEDDNEWYWEDYANDTYKGNFKTEYDAYDSLIAHLDNSYAKGGGVKQIEPQNEFGKYNEFIDMERTAKPAGFRYTNALAKKLRKDPQDAPTRQHIDKYKGKGVYFERRLDKSDANRNKKF